MFVLAASRDLTPFLTVLGVMILLLLATAVGLMWFRSRLLAKASSEAEVTGGLLRDLRAMRDRGEITIEEYDSARRAMAARAAEMGAAAKAAAAARSEQGGRKAADAREDGVEGVDEIRAHPGFDLTGRPLPKPPESGVPDPKGDQTR